MKNKKCSKCRKTKPLNEFYKNKHTKSGYSHQCKVCKKAGAVAWRKANPEKAVANA